MILVSSCLLGLCSKYDGTSTNINKTILEFAKTGKIIPICPEQMGGLPTPRLPAEIILGDGHDVLSGKAKVINSKGHDVTREFIKGAGETLKITKCLPVKAAILKERSPSCGSNQIYDGTFSGKTIAGQGVTAALLQLHNIPVFPETNPLIAKVL